MEVEDDNGKVVKVQVDETKTLLAALKNRGTSTDIQGVRINNIKYYISRYDGDEDVFYFRGVNNFSIRMDKVVALHKPKKPLS